MKKIQITSSMVKWILLVIITLDLATIYFYDKHLSDYIEILKIIISGIPGIVFLMLVSLGMKGSEIKPVFQGIIKTISFAGPSLASYLILNQQLGDKIETIKSILLLLLLGIIFVSILIIMFLQKK